MKIALIAPLFVCLLLTPGTHSSAQSETPRGRILDRNGEILAGSSDEGLRAYPKAEIASHLTGYVRSDETGLVRNRPRPGKGPRRDAGRRKRCGRSPSISRNSENAVGKAFPRKAAKAAVVVIDPRERRDPRHGLVSRPTTPN